MRWVLIFVTFAVLSVLVSAERRNHGRGGGNNGRRGAAVQRVLVNTLCNIEQPALKSETVKSRDCRSCTNKCSTSRGSSSDTAKCFSDCTPGGDSGTANGGGSRRRQSSPFKTIFRSGTCRDLFGCYRTNCTSPADRNNRRQQGQANNNKDAFSAALAQRQTCVKDQCQARLSSCQSDATIIQLCNQQKCLIPCFEKCDADCADVCRVDNGSI